MKKAYAGFVLVMAIIISMLIHAVLYVPGMIAAAWSKSGYVKDWWLSMDQHLNVMLAGDKDEYLSSRLGKWYHYGAEEPWWFDKLIASWLFWKLHEFDPDHCFKSVDFTEGQWKWTTENTRPPLVRPSLLETK